MSKYILIGIPDCGKSTLGQRIADVLHLPFFDTDEMACNKMTVEHPFDFLRSYFMNQFRIEQYNAIVELSKFEGSAIIATGAEVALMPECVDIMKRWGLSSTFNEIRNLC